MYICEDCGDTRSELKEEYEHIGGFQSGKQGYTYTDDDCSCGGTYVEAVKCERCGDWASERFGGVCKACIENNATVSNAILFGETETEGIEVNGYYAKVFGEAQINSILRTKFNELTTEHERRLKAQEYCLETKYEFGEFLTNS